MRPVGRFAPSPTGLLHAGSLVAALASWLDARAQGGRWLVRIEDIDTPRCVPGAAQGLLAQLDACGLRPDAPPVWQSRRSGLYEGALTRLHQAGLTYPCTCSRSAIAAALSAAGHGPGHGAERVYPGTCRPPHGTPAGAPPLGTTGVPGPAWRVRTDVGPRDAARIDWLDRRLGAQTQRVAEEVGDFVVRRSDGLWAYQLAVVVDDADQGVTDVVRGEDLADNTARQIHLQRLLRLPQPRYLHAPLVRATDGQKLSKQTGAKALALPDAPAALAALRAAATVLGLHAPKLHDTAATVTLAQWLASAVAIWGERFPPPPLMA